MTENYLDGLATSEQGEGYRRLRAIFWFWGDQGTRTRAAKNTPFSRPWLYALTHRAAEALLPRTPGPKPEETERQRLQEEVEDIHKKIGLLKKKVDDLEEKLADAMELDTRTRDRLELLLDSLLVTPRGIQDVLDVAFPGQAPSAEAVRKRLKQRGKIAGDLMEKARLQVKDDIRVLAADEVHPQNQAVKVLMEPRSNAVMLVERWPQKKKEDWKICLEPFPNLSLLISDLDPTLVGVGNDFVDFHCADWWHESHYLNTELLWRLERKETALRDAAFKALQGAVRETGPGRRVQPETVEAAEAAVEAVAEEYFVAMAVIDSIQQLYIPIHPTTGKLWTEAEARAVAEAGATQLEGLVHPQAAGVARHLRRNAHRFVGWRGQFLSLRLGLRPESDWSAECVVNALLQIWDWESKVYRNDPEWKSLWRLARSFRRRLGHEVVDVGSAEVELRRALKYVARSSSGVESFNNRVQVMQRVHRRLSDEKLSLLGLRWNLQGRRSCGKRGGRSPYGMLGVDLGQGDSKPWYDVLLDAESALLSQRRGSAVSVSKPVPLSFSAAGEVLAFPVPHALSPPVSPARLKAAA